MISGFLHARWTFKQNTFSGFSRTFSGNLNQVTVFAAQPEALIPK